MSSMSRFKVGDRVRATTECDGNRMIVGKSGTVVKVFEEYYGVEFDELYCVEFDEPINGDDGLGHGKPGYCWDCLGRGLESAESQIIITYTGDKGEAHKALEAEIKRLSGAKATPERVERARALVGEILLGLIDGKYESVGRYKYAVFIGDGAGAAEERCNIRCSLRSRTGNEGVHTIAVCVPEDEYNVWIGRAVALCKAVDEKLPDWLIGKEG